MSRFSCNFHQNLRNRCFSLWFPRWACQLARAASWSWPWASRRSAPRWSARPAWTAARPAPRCRPWWSIHPPIPVYLAQHTVNTTRLHTTTITIDSLSHNRTLYSKFNSYVKYMKAIAYQWWIQIRSARIAGKMDITDMGISSANAVVPTRECRVLLDDTFDNKRTTTT